MNSHDTGWNPSLHSLFGQIKLDLKSSYINKNSNSIRLQFFTVNLSLKVRVAKTAESITVLSLNPSTGQILPKIKDRKAGNLFNIELLIRNYMVAETMSFDSLTIRNKLFHIQKIFEKAYLDYGHFNP